MKTLIAVRNVESTLRGANRDSALPEIERRPDRSEPGLGRFILLRSGHEKLRKRFAGYADVLERVVRLFDDHAKAETALLSQIHAERQRR